MSQPSAIAFLTNNGPGAAEIATSNESDPQEVIRLDSEGFHYRGEFIPDAGEAHRLMVAFLKQHTVTETAND